VSLYSRSKPMYQYSKDISGCVVKTQRVGRCRNVDVLEKAERGCEALSTPCQSQSFVRESLAQLPCKKANNASTSASSRKCAEATTSEGCSPARIIIDVRPMLQKFLQLLQN